MNADRQQHRQHVLAFLQAYLSRGTWELTLPRSGRGHETYVARTNGASYFVKLGARVHPYELLAALEVTPPVVTAGTLDDGTAIMVQHYVSGRMPSWQDFREKLEQMAAVVGTMHRSPALLSLLPAAPSPQHRHAGLAALARLQEKWNGHRGAVPTVAAYVDDTLATLEEDIRAFSGAGLIASHNDPCNGNWLVGDDGAVYLLDLEAMSQDDPAHDLGALLWWYYPPALRPRFLEQAGYDDTAGLRHRMRVRMALHCLDIILPRPGSFDPFDAGSFPEALRDFRAVVAGRENPHGYED